MFAFTIPPTDFATKMIVVLILALVVFNAAFAGFVYLMTRRDARNAEKPSAPHKHGDADGGCGCPHHKQ